MSDDIDAHAMHPNFARERPAQVGESTVSSNLRTLYDNMWSLDDLLTFWQAYLTHYCPPGLSVAHIPHPLAGSEMHQLKIQDADGKTLMVGFVSMPPSGINMAQMYAEEAGRENHDFSKELGGYLYFVADTWITFFEGDYAKGRNCMLEGMYRTAKGKEILDPMWENGTLEAYLKEVWGKAGGDAGDDGGVSDDESTQYSD